MMLPYPRPVVLRRDQVDPAIHVCRPIAGPRASKDRPWVSIATGRQDGAFVLAGRSDGARRLIDDATANLATCASKWTVAETRGALFWKRPSLLRAYGEMMVSPIEMQTEGGGIDDLSSDLVLRADVMAEAATMLRARTLFVVIPKRGWLLVGAGEPGDLLAMEPLRQAADGIAGRAGRDAISRNVFFFQGGALIGEATFSGRGGSISLRLGDEPDPWGLA
jgi:hypothetical protein